MTEQDQQIGKRLRMARKASGYKSARAFATKHDIPESTYSQHETGKRSLNPELMILYSDRLGISPGWLLTGQEGMVGELRSVREQGDQLMEEIAAQSERMNSLNNVVALRQTDILVDVDAFCRIVDALLSDSASNLSRNEVRQLIVRCVEKYNGSLNVYDQTERKEAEVASQ